MKPVVIYDQSGNPIELPGKAPTERAGSVPIEQRLDYGLPTSKPEVLKMAWNAADAGNMAALMRICGEVENDGRLGALLRQRRLAVSAYRLRDAKVRR